MYKPFVLVLGLLFILIPSAYAQDKVLVVAWIFNGELWLTELGNEAEQIDSQGIIWATLSPDQAHLAYVKNPDLETPAELLIYNISSKQTVVTLSSRDYETGPDERFTFSAPLWIDTTSIIFNTLATFAGPPGIENRYDIQRVDINGNRFTLAEPNAGGVMTLSHDRSVVAVTRAGEYNNANVPSTIQLLYTQTGQPASEPYQFPAVATGSEQPWFPKMDWKADSTLLTFTIPAPDLLYLSVAAPDTKICYLPLNASGFCRYNIEVSFPAYVFWNADLTHYAYILSNPENANIRQLVLGELSSEGDSTLRELPASEAWPEAVLWIDEDRLLFREASGIALEFYIVSLSTGEVTLWQPTGETVINLQPIDENRFVLATGDYINLTIGLYDMSSNQFTPLAKQTDGFVRFAER